MKQQPIIVIEDDKDDFELLNDIFKELNVPEPVIWFQNCKEALHYLTVTREIIFIIISDINLPGMSGMRLRRLIDEDDYLRRKSIPFVFYSSVAIKSEVMEAYEMIVQGFFIKGHSVDEVKETVDLVLKYWRRCLHPNAL